LRHDPKLAKLLQKANQSLRPWASFHRRGLRVHLVLNGPSEFILTRCNEHMLQILLHDDGLIADTAAATAADEPRGDWLSRQAVMAILGCSRSTAIRRLRRWHAEGLAQRRGTGRAALYRFS